VAAKKKKKKKKMSERDIAEISEEKN